MGNGDLLITYLGDEVKDVPRSTSLQITAANEVVSKMVRVR